ncbi:MAG TPA: maleylpyruvate isomerase family mycothiol-dependent enzyme [Jatrophihabitans sp.]|nr:maleylpyruvate isomerase family mycothiol-dependent enzyme [Jatrophihabitans sp.]
MTTLHPAAAGLDHAAEIALQSAAFADAAEGNLTARVEHCPGWTVADLVDHLTEVHWFWATIAEQQPTDPPAGERPERAPDDELIARFKAGALHLDEVLRRTDPTAPCWTWAPQQQDVGFILRHQVQEAAVHRWDAEHAAGRVVRLPTAASVDAVEEFLTFSVSTEDGYQKKDAVPLAGAFVLRATDADAAWTVSDDSVPGTLRFERGASPDVPVLASTASDLLLWLYARIMLPVPDGAQDLLGRFRALVFTD